jgi:D-alanyl-D-alanine endopeptidase (penicillin-binding protein 7)
MVYDISAGEVLFEKNADDPRPVASITKVVSALAWVSTDPDFDREVEIGAEQYPSRSGARSRLSTGDITSGLDLLGAALVSSDNRAALGLAAASDMHLEQFIGRMNAVSVELGMTHSSWVDPSGLDDENLSTARDIAKATLAVANHPVLASVASAPFWDLWRKNKEYVRRLGSTDRLQGRNDIIVEAAKTGYTDTARYCFTTVLETPTGRRLAITLLGADGKMTRWADINRIVSWVDSGQTALAVDQAASEKVRPAKVSKRKKGTRKRRK